MSIFGTTNPQFVYDHGGAGEVTIDLPRAVITKMRVKDQYHEHRSELDLDREFLHVSTHWEVSVRVNFGKFGSPLAGFQELAAYKGSLVSLWLFSDGVQFMKSETEDALFLLRNVTPIYLTDNYQHDAVVLDFESVDPIYRKLTYGASVLLFDVAPGYSEATFYPPITLTTANYFLLPLALDNSYIQVTNRTQNHFTISPAMDGGTVRCLLVDESVNGVSDYIRVGTFYATDEPSLVEFHGPDLLENTYMLLTLTDTGEPVNTLNHTVSGFEVVTDGANPSSGWYMAISLGAPDIDSAIVRVAKQNLDSGGTDSVVFVGPMPNADYMLICLDADDGGEYFSVSAQTVDGFTLTYDPVLASPSVIYAAFGRESYIAPVGP